MSVSISGDTGISKVQDGVITAANLEAGSVTTAKIADANVTTAKIADSNVTVAKLSATGTPSSSTFLRGDGSWQSAGGGQLQTVVFASTTTWTCPAGVTSILISVVGGGGGAGIQTSTINNRGGAGGCGTGIKTVVPGTTYTVTVGAGGVANRSGSNAGTGGESWFGVNSSSKLIYATGGQGAYKSGSPYVAGANGSGGSTTFGDGGSVATTPALWAGVGSRTPSNTDTSAIVWSASSGYIPGAYGLPLATQYSGNFAAGGVGGAISITYVG